MEVLDVMRNLDKLGEEFRTFLFEIPLILAAIAANDNRMELEITEANPVELPGMTLSERFASEAVMEPVAVERR